MVENRIPLLSVRIDCYLLLESFRTPAVKVRGPETPEFADTVAGDLSFPRHPLQCFRMDSNQSSSFLTFDERLERFIDVG